MTRLASLPIEIFDVKAEGPMYRIEFDCHIQNPFPLDIYIMDSWIQIISDKGQRITDGRLLYIMNYPDRPAIIPKGEKNHSAIIIYLPSIIIQTIEEQRAGGDIDFLINSRILVSSVIDMADKKIIGLPQETQFSLHGQNQVKYHFAQSEWVKILRNLTWSEIELIELPSLKYRSNPSLTRAFARLDDARDHYRKGNWKETMFNCRMSFESLVKDLTKSDDMSKSLEAILSIVDNNEKAQAINSIIKELSNYLHLGRHEKQHPVDIKRIDAQLSLHQTAVLLRYLSS